MKGKLFICLGCFLFVTALAPGLFAGDTIYIALSEAYLLEGPGTEYSILAKVTDHDPLALISVNGDWFEVQKRDGVIGWLHRIVLSHETVARYSPPERSPRGSFLDTLRPHFEGGDNPSITGSAGSRGIGAESESGGFPQDYFAVHYMESFVVTDDEIRDFIIAGGLIP